MKQLPHWVLTDSFPAFYDSESLTAIQQTARVYAKMQELVEGYNQFVTEINQQIEDFEATTNQNYETFTTTINQLCEDAVSFMKTNLVQTIKELNEDDQLDPLIMKAILNIEDELIAQQQAFEEDINLVVNRLASGNPLAATSTSGMSDTTRVYVNTTDGHWYYHNGSAWVDGGVYQSTEVSDSSISFSKLTSDVQQKIGGWIEKSFTYIKASPTNDETYADDDYLMSGNTRATTLSPLTAKAGDKIIFNDDGSFLYTVVSIDSTSHKMGANLSQTWISGEEFTFISDSSFRLYIKRVDGENFTNEDLEDLLTTFTLCEYVKAEPLDKSVSFHTLDDELKNKIDFMEEIALQMQKGEPTDVETYADQDYIKSSAKRAVSVPAMDVKIGEKIIFNGNSNFVYSIAELDPATHAFIKLLIGGWVSDTVYTFTKNTCCRVYFKKVDDSNMDDTSLALANECFTYEKHYGKYGQEKESVYYVSPNGNDTNDGKSKETPFATIQKAIDKGAEIVFCERGNYYNQSITKTGGSLKILPYPEVETVTDNERTLINICNYTKVDEYTVTDGIVSFSFEGNDRFEQVFIDGSLTPETDVSRPSYNVGLWQIHSDIALDAKLKPVLTLAEVQAEAGTFTWIDGVVSINPLEEDYTAFHIHNDIEIGLILNNLDGLVIEDLAIYHSYSKNFRIKNCMNAKLVNCQSYYTMSSDGIGLDYSNIELINCRSYKARNDGFNIHYAGISTLINCEGCYNYDDGISHHEGTKGILIGGKYNHNGKGGNSPTYGAEVNCYNIMSCDNYYGIYAVSTNEYPYRNIVSSGCIYKGNQVAFRVENTLVDSINDKVIDNTSSNVVQNNGVLNIL